MAAVVVVNLDAVILVVLEEDRSPVAVLHQMTVYLCAAAVVDMLAVVRRVESRVLAVVSEKCLVEMEIRTVISIVTVAAE